MWLGSRPVSMPWKRSWMSATSELMLITVSLLYRVYINWIASESMEWCARSEITSSLRSSFKESGSSISPSICLLQASFRKLTIFSLFSAINRYRRGAEQLRKVRDSTPEYIYCEFCMSPCEYMRSILMLVGAIAVLLSWLGSLSSLRLRVKLLMWLLHSISSSDDCMSSFVLSSVRLSELLRK